MTTISNHSNSLIDPLARTKGGCATTTEPDRNDRDHGEEEEGYNGMMPILGLNHEHDEEIASVEADGTVDDCHDDQGGGLSQHHGHSVEKKILTAALVTSMADASTACSAGASPTQLRHGGTESLTRNSVRNETQMDNSITFPMSASHVTPPTSEASSFSSVETMGDQESSSATNESCSQALSPKASINRPIAHNPVASSVAASNNSRTMYPHASKLAASTQVSSALTPVSPRGTSTKRKIDAVTSEQQAPVIGKLMYPSAPQLNQSSSVPSSGPFCPASSSVPNPLAGMDTPSKTPPPQPQVTFQYMQYQQATYDGNEADKTNSLMSANLQALRSSSDSPPQSNEGRSKRSDSNNSFSAVAESMSQQQYQTDNLMSSSTNDLMSPQQQPQQGRGRIFSIDLDPAVLDFVESVVDPLGSSDDPDGVPQGRSRNYSVTFDDDVNSHSGRLSFRRDRGFSFEFFSFGIDGDEPLPFGDEVANSTGVEAKGNRVRGDSIIFDPISFHDGGIHETSALMHVKHESQDDNIQDLAGSLATVAFQAHHVQVPPSIIHNPPQAPLPTHSMPLHVTAQHSLQKGQSSVASLKHVNGPVANHKANARQVKTITSPKQRAKAKASQNIYIPPQQAVSSNYRQVTVSTSSSSRNFPQSFTDNTINMPHGSDAAAAAAAGMNQVTSSTSHSDGFGGISHTSCPMELLNKGGRIGIYLPEERKARIAKFHDKRKQRMWRKKIKYDCRKKLADSRPRIKGRFVKRSDVDGEEC